MSTASRFYLEQADSCTKAAEAAALANQREILLRSRAVWLGLAEREIEVQTARAERERTKQVETAHE
ncbi:hypothetical protein [Novosphingobium sp. B 225]|uniref:hypothetical protein n=1 Tax=Novosphingobium sp. B 225 TaxID=1961849 RepID=UPI000B4A9841|nr:hypothetical protein [Novosphingobium sp. B 225]